MSALLCFKKEIERSAGFEFDNLVYAVNFVAMRTVKTMGCLHREIASSSQTSNGFFMAGKSQVVISTLDLHNLMKNSRHEIITLN